MSLLMSVLNVADALGCFSGDKTT